MDEVPGMEEVKEQKTLLSQELIETIINEGRLYTEYQNQAYAVSDKLNKQIKEYFEANKLWESTRAISEVYHRLPAGFPKKYLDDAYYEQLLKNKEMDISDTSVGEPVSCKMLENVKCMGRIYKKKNDIAANVEKKLARRVVKYLEHNNLWTQEGIFEVIKYLPAGYFRFVMYQNYYELKNKEK